ncbi:hypothetical protein BBJ28_00006687 [Nothophytophthora sp. Chile5]|nr:hypothetical protein BBJ28_00006687 [Nothophytophthora sp. Chile5]
MAVGPPERQQQQSGDSMEKELSASSGLTLGESPEDHSPRRSFFACSKRSSESARMSSSDDSSRSMPLSKDANNRRRATADGVRRPLTLPHTITERHGGQELWVKAPVVSGTLEKRGFRWRRKWKPRFVELDGRHLAYFEDVSDFTTSPPTSAASKRRHKPKRRVPMTADAVLEDIDDRTFAVTPGPDEKPWLLRAGDAATKRRWLRALSDCVDILVWLRHYTMGKVLGVGGNGVVQRLEDQRDGSAFAVKIVDVAKFRHREAVVAEVEILRSITNTIKHPNLITIHKVYEEHRKVYIIQELCTGGELYDRVVQRGKYSERDAASIMFQLVSALQALHAHNILHLDIKPENILFASEAPDSKILLTDFGLARMVNGKQNPLEQGKSMAGTIGYMAPEVITAHSYTEAADVFSAGVILFILLVGYPPFYGDSEVEILMKIARGDFTFDPQDWAHVSGSAKELVARMLQVRAQERITVDEVLAHPWITRVDDGTLGASVDDRELSSSMMARLQRFNMDRKSENMGSFMASMLADENEADFQALVDETTIDMMIRQLSVEGRDSIPLRNAHVMAKGLGLSPYIDEKTFVRFLDQNHDGFIDASDFCEGVRALRNHHQSFATMVFAALHKMQEDGQKVAKEDLVLTRAHFAVAFDKLECPEPLAEVFFKFMDEQEEKRQNAVAAMGHSSSIKPTPSSWTVDEAEFAVLFTQFSFLGMLFLRTAKDNMVSIVKSRSTDGMPRISEDSHSS